MELETLSPPHFWMREGAYMIDAAMVGAGCLALGATVPGEVSTLFQVALSAAYYSILPVINAGQTPGKMLAGIAIVRQDGAPLTYVHSFVRWIGYLISGIAMGLGFALVLFTPLKRGVHDYVAGTRVVQVEQVSPSRRRGVILFGVASLLLAIVVGFLAATQP